MVKVREEEPLKADGSIDIDLWLEKIYKQIEVKDKARLKKACEIAWQLDKKEIPNINKDNDKYYINAKPLSTSLQTAELLSELNMQEDSIIAAILYRFVRLGLLDLKVVEAEFDADIAKLIESTLEMMIISKLQFNRKKTLVQEEAQTEQMRKMLISLIDDFRVALIKLAERCVALRLAKDLPEEKRQRVAREVKEIYAPLAHRFGVGQIKWEMEDLSFRYLQPNEYKNIAKLLAEKRLDRTDYIKSVVKDLQHRITEYGIEGAQVNGRAKHIYSIWRKMQRKNLKFSEIYDIRAVRILVPKTSHCYEVLGIVHSIFKHIPKEFDDYIANPKANGYKSLHTAVLGPENKVLEIQIRTFEMHDEAELGVCAHWVYKGTDVKRNSLAYEEKIAWLRQALEMHDDFSNESLAEQWFAEGDTIYVFTPQEEILNMDKNSTPIDFAYRIHTQVGHKCKGAKVNGKIVPLTYKLQMGDKVEILTSAQPSPSRDWLNPHSGFTASARTRNKVYSWFKKQDREQNLKDGKNILEKEFKRLHFPDADYNILAQSFNLQNAEDLFVALGAGDLNLSQIISSANNLFVELDDEEHLAKVLAKSSGKKSKEPSVSILGISNLMNSMACCCNPIPGDDIRGFITNNKGVSIHKSDCKNLLNLANEDANRIVEVSWRVDTQKPYPSNIKLEAWDRDGLLKDVTTIISNEKGYITSFKSELKENNIANLFIQVETKNLVHLSRILGKLSQLPNVLEVYRV